MSTTTEQRDAMLASAQSCIDAFPRVLPVKELLPMLYETFAEIDRLTEGHPNSTLCGNICGMKLLLDELVASVYGLTPKEAAVT
jgi:hypothetical protein